MPINWWTGKENLVHPYNSTLFSHEEERSTDAATTRWAFKTSKWEKLGTEGHMLHRSIHMNYPEETESRSLLAKGCRGGRAEAKRDCFWGGCFFQRWCKCSGIGQWWWLHTLVNNTKNICKIQLRNVPKIQQVGKGSRIMTLLFENLKCIKKTSKKAESRMLGRQY